MKIQKTLMAALSIVAAGSAQAALIDRGGGLVYDTVLDVTWLQDANYAKTSSYNASGLMNWTDATAWAANLSYVDTVRNVTYTDWRLPAVAPVNGSHFVGDTTVSSTWSGKGETDWGYHISAPNTLYAGSTASEMAYMYYQNLQNPGLHWASSTIANNAPNDCYVSSGNTCLDNVDSFFNLQTSNAYWSGTEYVSGSAWVFTMSTGAQTWHAKANTKFAWAVRDGDVVAATVPGPATYALLLTGLGFLGVSGSRRNRQPN
jgi:hypothetical protein